MCAQSIADRNCSSQSGVRLYWKPTAGLRAVSVRFNKKKPPIRIQRRFLIRTAAGSRLIRCVPYPQIYSADYFAFEKLAHRAMDAESEQKRRLMIADGAGVLRSG
ncbi:hypothetical protein NDU88_008630 [Pleurodeles waltl]|uniref:Uncharacterized protein n=1 Tax=Pleurodeles waltl TaxID=8319 RepID=A0AAV7NWL8_PLEWA|nr:hypothetical protein NDU88_008630 [Pleurodeles waltl]